jgi:hypothetical protein
MDLDAWTSRARFFALRMPSAADVADVTMFRSGFPPTPEHREGALST